jgi:hypothetical protein
MNISSLHDDSAENSIMQTITIAVSAILIAAGLVTAPGLINNARDNNATTELANIAYSQEYQLGAQGKYLNYESLLNAQKTANAEGIRGAKITPSGGVKNQTVLTCNAPSSWLAAATSSSGKTFYRSSDSAKTSSTLSEIKYDSTCIDATSLPKNEAATPTQPDVPAQPALSLDERIFANPGAFCPRPEPTADEQKWLDMNGGASGYYNGTKGAISPEGWGYFTYSKSAQFINKDYYKGDYESGNKVSYRVGGPSSILVYNSNNTVICSWVDNGIYKSSLNNGGPSKISYWGTTILMSYTNDQGVYDRADGPASIKYDTAKKKIVEAEYYHNGEYDETAPNFYG